MRTSFQSFCGIPTLDVTLTDSVTAFLIHPVNLQSSLLTLDILALRRFTIKV